MSRKLTDEDLVDLYERCLSQFAEDRTAIKDLYKDLRAVVATDPHYWTNFAEPLGKYAELSVKQTAQMIEILKLAQKHYDENNDDGDLTIDDLDAISAGIEKN